MMQDDLMLYLALALLAAPILASLWHRQRERAQWRRAVARVPKRRLPR